MRYNIYQVSDEPIAKGERVTSADFFDRSFIGTIRDVGSREKELERFGRWLTAQKLGTLSGNTFTLVPDVCQRRFSYRYRTFLEAADAVSAVTEEQFQSGTGVEDLLFNLRQLFTDEFDDYVFYDDELLPMDSFLRIAKPDVIYHIGGICGYQ